METFSTLLAICVGNSPVTGEFPAQGTVTRSFDIFWMYSWLNDWVNIGQAGDLRCHYAHYDVTVMTVDVLALLAYKVSAGIQASTGTQASSNSIYMGPAVEGSLFKI